MENQNDFYAENDIKNQTEETSAENSADEPIIEEEKLEEDYNFAPIIFPTTTKPLFDYSKNFLNGYDFEIFNEERKIKRAANTAGISFLVMLGTVTVLNLLLTAIGIVSYAISGKADIVEFISDSFFVQVLQTLFSVAMLTFPFIFVFKKFKVKIGDLFSFSKPKAKRGLPLFFIGLGACAFANIADSIIGSIIEKLGIENKSIAPQEPEGIYGFLIVFVSTAVAPALLEEFACRGLVMGLFRKFGEGFAIIASSVLFSLMHANFDQIPFAFMVGLALAFIAIKSESLWPAVAVHFVNNLSAVVFAYSPFSVNLSNILYIVFLCISLLLGLLGILLLRNDKEVFVLHRGEQKISEKKKFACFFKSAPIIITIIYCLVEAVFYYFSA